MESEFDCQICLDIMVEPSTTSCGHTFCRSCLVKYLGEKLACPMCRKPILQSAENTSKNISFENVIRSKFPEKYKERLDQLKLTNTETLDRNNLPSIVQQGCYVWPKTKKTIILQNLLSEYTIDISSVNDRILVIIPGDPRSYPTLACIVEILSKRKQGNRIELEVKGVKRFLVTNFTSHTQSGIHLGMDSAVLYLASGSILQDIEVQSDDLLVEIFEKLKHIQQIHEEVLSNRPSSFTSVLENQFGKFPIVTKEMSSLENASIFYLNILRGENKDALYKSKNLIERVDW